MALENILSISGKSGLFKLVGQMKNGIIVESIVDGKRFPVHGSSKVSALEEISIYTDEEEVPLKDVFKSIYEKEGGKQAVDPKDDNDKLKAYFEEILPTYDRERVYVSDMGKVIRWYNLLIEQNAYDPTEKEEEGSEEDSGEKKVVKEAKKAPGTSSRKASTKSAGKRPAGGGNVKSPRKAGGSQRGG